MDEKNAPKGNPFDWFSLRYPFLNDQEGRARPSLDLPQGALLRSESRPLSGGSLVVGFTPHQAVAYPHANTASSSARGDT